MSAPEPNVHPERTPEATPEASAPASRPNGLTDEQVRDLLAAAGRRKHDPDYLNRLLEGVAEYRRDIQKEVERELAEQDTK